MDQATDIPRRRVAPCGHRRPAQSALDDRPAAGGAACGDTSALAVGSVVGGLLAYVFFALVTRALGAEPAAPVSVLWAWWSFAGAALTFPLQHWITRSVTAHGGERAVRRALARVVLVVAGVAAAAGVVSWLARDLLFGPTVTCVPPARRRRRARLRAAGRRPRHAERPAPVRRGRGRPGRRERAALRRRRGPVRRGRRQPRRVRRRAWSPATSRAALWPSSLRLGDREGAPRPSSPLAFVARASARPAARPGDAHRRPGAARRGRRRAGRGHRPVRGAGAVPGAVHARAGAGRAAHGSADRARGPGPPDAAAAVPRGLVVVATLVAAAAGGLARRLDRTRR